MAVITSKDYFLINGVSSATVGLYVDTPQVPPMAEQRTTQWDTGLDSDFVSPDDVWENITVSFTCFLFFRENNFDISPVYAFLKDAKTLEFTRFPDRYLKIKSIGNITPAQQIDGARIRFVISFVCDPFKYHTSNSPITMSDLDPEITNPGTRYSRPLYKVTHGGAGCSVYVNGELLKIKPWTDKNGLTTYPPTPIYIDSERMVAYSISGENKVNATKFTDGSFPFLKPGINSAYTSGNSLEITGNWRDY